MQEKHASASGGNSSPWITPGDPRSRYVEESTIILQIPIKYKRIKKRYKRRRSKKRLYVLIGLSLFLIVFGIALSTVGYPVLDDRYHQDLALAQTGLAGCTIVWTIAARFHDPLNAKTQSLTTADMTVLNQNLQQLKLILNQAVQQVNQLQPEDLQLDPRLSKLVSEFHARLPLI